MADTDKLVLDEQRWIIQEYQNNLRSAGEPGIGDVFLKWALTNEANPARCELVTITPTGTSGTDFQEFPADSALEGFDTSDRKFVAVTLACTPHPPILQAVDTKWKDFEDALRLHGVTIEFLCPRDLERLRQRRAGRRRVRQR